MSERTEYVCGDGEQCGQCLECAMVAQGAELDRVNQRVAELEADKARLDWLEKHRGSVNFAMAGPHCYNGQNALDNHNHFFGHDYRAAIDAAMAQQKEQMHK